MRYRIGMELMMCLAELADDLWHVRESDGTDPHRGAATKTAACGREVIGDLGFVNLDSPHACPLCVHAVRSLILS